jgi:hypothetical protein
MGLETPNPYRPMIWRISTKELRDISVLYQEGEYHQEKGRKQSLLRVFAEEKPTFKLLRVNLLRGHYSINPNGRK